MTSLCVIDWVAAGSWAQAVAGLSGAGAVIWAANKGAATFGTWLQQKQTERRIDVADRLLTLVYKLERTFPGIRSPATYGWESDAAREKLRADRPGFDNEPEDQRRRLEMAQVVITRVASQQAIWDELSAALPTAKAYFGDDFKNVLEGFWRAAVRIRVAGLAYPDAPDRDRASRLEGDFWEEWGEVAHGEDPVGAMVKAAVTQSEAVLVPILRSHIADA